MKSDPFVGLAVAVLLGASAMCAVSHEHGLAAFEVDSGPRGLEDTWGAGTTLQVEGERLPGMQAEFHAGNVPDAGRLHIRALKDGGPR